MGWLIFIIVAILIAVLIVFIQNKNLNNYIENQTVSIKKTLYEIKDFNVTIQIIGHFGKYIFAVDEENEKIVFITNNTQNELTFKKEFFSFSDIIGVELISNGKTTVSKKSTTRTIGGAIVGGVIAGGAGAIIGGLSGDTKQNDVITMYEVKILLRSIEKSSLNWYAETANANKIKDIVSVIIDKTDKKHEIIKEKTQTQAVNSIADELFKMNELKEKGIITEQEFINQKQKILNK